MRLFPSFRWNADGRRRVGEQGAEGPVFQDSSGRRARRLRRAGLAVGVVCLVYASMLGVSFVGNTSLSPSDLQPFDGADAAQKSNSGSRSSAGGSSAGSAVNLCRKQLRQPSGKPAGHPCRKVCRKRFGQPCGELCRKRSGQPSVRPSGQSSRQPAGQATGQQSTQSVRQLCKRLFKKPHGGPGSAEPALSGSPAPSSSPSSSSSSSSGDS
ncbi:hypothetical protein DB35_16965 [Streptomyces abyssalis]|uniref:Transmembrane protein n=1 Tax=Streptomyces abyssalis TaxID=933944 RepID=A0A1E7JKG0_9ACTN|nr:hypothetical protein [Streptomyces abyssalis]OEU88109.1 hypothetical protein AN215_18140 [Streptomyces abyssalis]OEU90980.1 hypothetical protein DB35_16965 [Streptomyces abyssalis]OEV31004.1 hypothetical protein AN219_07545 [Streptomyces nanshensis]